MNISNEVEKFGQTGMPERYKEFGQKVCQLAKEYEFNELSLTIRPGFSLESDWPNPININWQQGRHGEENDIMRITSELNFCVSTKPDQADNQTNNIKHRE